MVASPSPCGRYCAVGQRDDGTSVAVPLRCNSWLCRRCAPRLKRRLLSRLQGTQAHTFMTLTANPSAWPSPGVALDVMGAAIPHLFKRIRRRVAPASVEYMLVWEYTAKGWPHAHLLLRGPYIPRRWLSRVWEELTAAPIVDLRAVTTSTAAVNYLAKYLTKSSAPTPGHRRYRFSRHFLTSPPLRLHAGIPGVSTWRIFMGTLSEWLLLMRSQGSRVGIVYGAIGIASTTCPGTPLLAAFSAQPP